jgi:hypothetical protein
MKNTYQTSGLHTGLELFIDKNWTPEQALAVFELLDDLRELILNYYQHPIQALLKETQGGDEEIQVDNHPENQDF